jgi:DNA invertase Pin-like site-specific DNA recombinase
MGGAPVTGQQQQLRLVLAARKSTKIRDGDGHQVDPISIQIQDQRGREWAERQGHVIVAVTDDIKSGTVAPWDRPKLRPWVTDPALMASYDGILATKNDRLSRGEWDDEARIRQWAKQHGKVLVIADGPQWPPRDFAEEVSWDLLAKLAHQEWKDIRERSMNAQGKLREQGKLTGRPPVFYVSAGVKYDHTIVPTEEGRRLVPEIFGRCIRGESLATIAAWLAEETGRPWWPRTVGTLIRNPTYMGRRCAQDPRTRKYGRTLLRCEALVDAAIFRKAGKALDGRPKRGHVAPEKRAMLSGALWCPNPACTDSPMYRLASGYYRCTGRGANRKGCGNMVRVQVVDAAVNEIIAADFATPVMRHTVIPGNEAQLAARLEEIRFEISQLGMLDLGDEDYDRRLGELRAERDRVKQAEVVPERVELAPTGELYSALWARTPVPERGPWLARHGFRVTASKAEVAVEQDGERHIRELAPTS